MRALTSVFATAPGGRAASGAGWGNWGTNGNTGMGLVCRVSLPKVWAALGKAATSAPISGGRDGGIGIRAAAWLGWAGRWAGLAGDCIKGMSLGLGAGRGRAIAFAARPVKGLAPLAILVLSPVLD